MTLTLDSAAEVDRFHTHYTRAIDSGDLMRWPSFFAEDCRYRIITKENHDAGRPLCLVLCDSQGMLLDRISACMKLNVYAPRVWRHLVGRAETAHDGELIRARTNFAVFETIMGQPTQVLCTGEYDDSFTRAPDGLKLADRLCICDTAVIPGSLVFPV